MNISRRLVEIIMVSCLRIKVVVENKVGEDSMPGAIFVWCPPKLGQAVKG
jgi:hypothetical protein